MACIETHPLRPFLPDGCRVLFLGSFPPPRRRWKMPFFYPNFSNDHWRIQGLVFHGDKDFFVDVVQKTYRLDRILPFLRERGIGYYDTAERVCRRTDSASDKDLEILQPTDIRRLIASPECRALRAICATGEKAAAVVFEQFGFADVPKPGSCHETADGLMLWRLPSSSRAYPLPLERKAEAYRAMSRAVGLLG